MTYNQKPPSKDNRRYDPQCYDRVNTAQDAASRAPGKRIPLKVLRKLMITALDNDLKAGINRPYFKCPSCNDRLPITMGTYARRHNFDAYELICGRCISEHHYQKQFPASHHTRHPKSVLPHYDVLAIKLICPTHAGEVVLIAVFEEEL